MLKYTVEYNEQRFRWEVIRWGEAVNGTRVGEVVEKFDRDLEAEAHEICDYYNDMEDPALWSDIGCEFDNKVF